MKSFAHEIILDQEQHRVVIDGIPFPYMLLADPEIELRSVGASEAIGVLHIAIPADNVSLITGDGLTRRLVQAPADVELAWARRRAVEIVHEELAPIIRWIGEGMPKS